MTMLTTGKLARKAGVKIETIRYYERRGLLPEPERRESGYRQYTEDDVKRMQFIKHAKELGFSLNEILELLSLRVNPDTTCRDVKKRAKAKILNVEEKLQSLQRIRKALEILSASCSGIGPISKCPILDALDSTSE